MSWYFNTRFVETWRQFQPWSMFIDDCCAKCLKDASSARNKSCMRQICTEWRRPQSFKAYFLAFLWDFIRLPKKSSVKFFKESVLPSRLAIETLCRKKFLLRPRSNARKVYFIKFATLIKFTFQFQVINSINFPKKSRTRSDTCVMQKKKKIIIFLVSINISNGKNYSPAIFFSYFCEDLMR